jgi:hypothetical protein
MYIVLVFHRTGVGRWDVGISPPCIVVSVIACLCVGVLNVGRALEVATLKIHMKQREKEEYIQVR